MVLVSKGKTCITIRLDEDLVEWFKQQVHAAGGGNYQSLINAALRKYIEEQGEPLEETLRRTRREHVGLFGKKGPDRRLLKLDDRFTAAAKNEERDPSGTAATYRGVLSELHALSGLSSDDEAYRQRLASILERRIKDLG